MNTDRNDDTEHFVKHKYRNEIIIPLCALTDNVSFLMSSGNKYITFIDGKRCKVSSWEEKHICELEEDIKRLYGIDAWSFVKRWYKTYRIMSSMTFLHIKCDEGGNDE